LKELEAYKQTDAYKVYTKKQREHKHSKASQGNKTHTEALPLPKAAREPKVIDYFKNSYLLKTFLLYKFRKMFLVRSRMLLVLTYLYSLKTFWTTTKVIFINLQKN
jgi:hypothetical protein